MRLLDQIALGQIRQGAAEAARLVQEATLRYIVDGSASRQCFDLVRADLGMLDPANALLRLPAELFWLEWLCEASPGTPANHRLGALVQSRPDGRSGVILPFWQRDKCEAVMSPVRISFDLDQPVPPPPGSFASRRLKHVSLPHLDSLFAHMLAEVDVEWADACRRADPKGLPAAVRAEAEAVWFNLPFVLSFALLLDSRGAVEQRPADIARLNRARLKRGRPALLDHIEVSLRIGTAPQPSEHQSSGRGREAPRLHFVRGHSVRRGDKIFWRIPHMRGDADRPIATKTVNVRS